MHQPSTETILKREDGFRRCEIATSNFFSLLFCWDIEDLKSSLQQTTVLSNK